MKRYEQVSELLWSLKAQTESRWRMLPADHAEQMLQARRYGWQPCRETTWNDPLSSTEITDAESMHGIEWPADFKAFLAVLGSLGPLHNVGYRGVRNEDDEFLHPILQSEAIRELRSAPPQQLLLGDAPWLRRFEAKGTFSSRSDALESWVSKRAPIWPLYGNRVWLVCGTNHNASPVISVHDGDDVVVLGKCFLDYLSLTYRWWIDEELSEQIEKLARGAPVDFGGWEDIWSV